MSKDKIIKFFERQDFYSEAEGSNIGLVLDTETTGIEDDAELIEICILPFSFNDDMEICKVYNAYTAFEQSSKPLTPEIEKITGITDDMIKGQSIDDYKVNALFNKAELVIAHNAKFDKRIMKNRFPTLKKIPWACSAYDPSWQDLSITSRALDYIAYRLGFWFDHHRAENDCRATLHVLSHELSPGRTAFKSMIEKAFEPSYRLNAAGANFASKDTLKAMGYRWDGKGKVWFTNVSENDKEDAERKLSIKVPECTPEYRLIPAYDRFS